MVKKSAVQITLSLLITSMLLLLVANVHAAQELRVGGGQMSTENVLNRIKQPFEEKTGIKLVLSQTSAVQSLKELDEGKIEAAFIAMSFPDWVAVGKKNGYNLSSPGQYYNNIIGIDTIRVFANKNINVNSLTRDKLAGIFTGSIKNWKEVGGADEPIIVVRGDKLKGTDADMQNKVMQGKEFANNAVIVGTAREVKDKIIATPGAIGLGPTAFVDETVKVISYPYVTRPVTLLIKGTPSDNLKILVDFLRGEGKKYLMAQ